jgi:chemotaxis protein methyltransferase CheR
MVDEAELERVEVELVLEAILKRWGYDFRNYARESVRRRLSGAARSFGLGGILELIPPLLRDEAFFASLLAQMTVPVTEMFRDPPFFQAFRAEVVPLLKTYPFAKLWHAGCATGEEVYSMAILLAQEGLAERAMIYATDLSEAALERARQGIYPLGKMKEYTRNYQRAGGLEPFSSYYLASYESAIMDQSLKRNVVFSTHNLAMDGVFSEMHCIVCRNVLIYFNRTLQQRVLRLFHESLVRGGILVLGAKESLRFSDLADRFTVVNDKWRIYRKIS